MAEKRYLTKEGLKKLKLELEHLRKVVRGEVAAKIKEARDMGDVLENSFYDAAVEEKSYVEGRIKEIEDLISSAEVVDKPAGENSDKIQVGSTVVVEFSGREDTFSIVGSSEADPVEKKISNESPVGSALLGAREGEEVKVETPVFAVTYKIKEIK